MPAHKVVSHEQWLAARTEFLKEEKEFTRLRDRLTERRQALPWEKVEKDYRFDGPRGKLTLAEMFDGRSQLVIYHFMFAPDWDAGCPHCSFWADNFDGIDVHLNQRDITFAAVSRAPLAKLEAYRRRMGWSFPWFSSQGSDFNFDFQASFTPDEMARQEAFYNYARREPEASDREGVSVFYKDPGGGVFHTYSTYARGIDLLNGAYNYIDLTPKGRDEGGRAQFWVRRHDEYDGKASAKVHR